MEFAVLRLYGPGDFSSLEYRGWCCYYYPLHPDIVLLTRPLYGRTTAGSRA